MAGKTSDTSVETTTGTPEGGDGLLTSREVAPRRREDPAPAYCPVCGRQLERQDTEMPGGYDTMTGAPLDPILRSVVQCSQLFHFKVELRDGHWVATL